MKVGDASEVEARQPISLERVTKIANDPKLTSGSERVALEFLARNNKKDEVSAQTQRRIDASSNSASAPSKLTSFNNVVCHNASQPEIISAYSDPDVLSKTRPTHLRSISDQPIDDVRQNDPFLRMTDNHNFRDLLVLKSSRSLLVQQRNSILGPVEPLRKKKTTKERPKFSVLSFSLVDASFLMILTSL